MDCHVITHRNRLIPRNDGTSNKPRCLLPYIRYPEPDEDTIKRRSSRLLYRIKEVVHGFLLVSFKFEKCFPITTEVKDRDTVSDPSEFEKELHLFHSESIDIQPLFPDEHLELSLDLRGTVSIGTINRYHSFILFCWCGTDGANSRDFDDLLLTCSHFCDHRYDLWDDLTRSHDEDRIPLPHSLLRELIIVMQCRSSDDDTTHIRSFEIGHWSDCARSSDRVLYREDSRSHLLGWELICDRISRMMLRPSEFVPEGHIIELQDHSIDIEVEIKAPFRKELARSD